MPKRKSDGVGSPGGVGLDGEHSVERGRVIRESPGFSDDEREERERLHRRYKRRHGSGDEPEKKQELRPPHPGSNTASTSNEEAREQSSTHLSQPNLNTAPISREDERDEEEEPMPREPKPWETIVIGDLGENLSYIETKDREIERQRYIVRYHQENSPEQVHHNQRILEELIREREGMEDNEENNMPEDQREEKTRIGERLNALHWGLDTCQFEGEEVNIRAAIEGYHSGQIPYSDRYTLLYAGHIVDVCPTYRSFCVDREERLDRYFEQYGQGWLWHEPPLAGPEAVTLAKKAFCSTRMPDKYEAGHHSVYQTYTVDTRKVMRSDGYPGPQPQWAPARQTDDMDEARRSQVTCNFQVILDTGATFPMLRTSDVKQLNIDLKWYASQGIMPLTTVGDHVNFRFYEMFVGMCTETGETLVAAGGDAVFPGEPRVLGSYVPVTVDHTDSSAKGNYRARLSGMVALESCYLTSAPTRRRLWLGEDRRDVLGTSRLPAHLRYDTFKTFPTGCPPDLEELREKMGTPDSVTFIHGMGNGRLLSDTDLADVRGRSQLFLAEKQQVIDKRGRKREKMVVVEDHIIEPGTITQDKLGKKPPPKWVSEMDSYATIKARNDREAKSR
ncbi:hypothetical protein F4778DRAFT_321221 [Xylariomycetidae sp. FL2044]|nr:hypothetical protein F4778DRAFT_321221 [Xylariomycetidae sp. FL2044]